MLNPFKKQDEGAAGVADARKKMKSGSKPERTVFGVILAPHTTEKSSLSKTSRGWYTFKVGAGADKISIKRAVKELYGVNAQEVHTVNLPSKKIRIGRIGGRTPGFKKAIVKLKEGEKIEI